MTYEPPVGGFAVATVRDKPSVFVVRVNKMNYFSVAPVEDTVSHPATVVKNLRPVPGFSEFNLASALLDTASSRIFANFRMDKMFSGAEPRAGWKARQLGDLVDLVKFVVDHGQKERDVAEPTRAGAIVEDVNGDMYLRVPAMGPESKENGTREWVRFRSDYEFRRRAWSTWDEIGDVVEVHHPGWDETKEEQA